MLLEAFQKKDQRDEAFAAVVAAASEFDLDLSDREGAWCDHSQVASIAMSCVLCRQVGCEKPLEAAAGDATAGRVPMPLGDLRG